MLYFISSYAQPFLRFWQKAPCLLYALGVFFGIEMALYWHPVFIILWLFLLWPAFVPSSFRSQLFKTAVLSLSSLITCLLYFQFPHPPPSGIMGSGIFDISSISQKGEGEKMRWVYTGTLRLFNDNTRNIPCRISFPITCQRLLAGSYLVTGTLKERRPRQYTLHCRSCDPWTSLSSWSLAEYRYRAKQKITQQLQKALCDPGVTAFLTGLATGEYDDPMMVFSLRRLGLQHLLAISGFHFGLLCVFLNFFFRLFLSRKKTAILLIVGLTSYCLFIGFAPSVQRAWMMVVLILSAVLLERPANGLNALGASMLFTLMSNPLLVENLSFQFSFAITAALLLFTSLIEKALQKVIPKYSLKELLLFTRASQHGYLLLGFFRQSLALTFAVTLAALPLTLYFFHKFPWLSLFYNLFFPFLVSLSLFLLLLGVGFGLFLPSLGQLFHHLNEKYTSAILSLTHHAPNAWEICLRVEEFPASLTYLLLAVLFSWGVYTERD